MISVTISPALFSPDFLVQSQEVHYSQSESPRKQQIDRDFDAKMERKESQNLLFTQTKYDQ